MSSISISRRGITLMEVMISIGILAIGLTSVLSLIPAGKSQVTRAVVYDRASALAANVLADAATFGLLKPESLALTGLTTASLAIFDPSYGAGLPGGSATMKSQGIYSSGTTVALSTTNDRAVLRLLAQGRDDVAFNAPVDEDSLPTNQFPAIGPRSFQGKMSCLLAVSSTAALAAGNYARLSAVVFHNRDLSAGAPAAIEGTWDGAGRITLLSLPPDRTLRETVRPGTVIFAAGSFHQLSMAAIEDATVSAFVSFSGAAPATTGSVRILLDSVGLAEKSVILEGSSPWCR